MKGEVSEGGSSEGGTPLYKVMRAVSSGSPEIEVKVALRGYEDLRIVLDYLSRAGYKLVSLRQVKDAALLRAIRLS